MYPMTDHAFRVLIEKGIPLDRLEKRLRPHFGYSKSVPPEDWTAWHTASAAEDRDHDGWRGYSREGFLGRSESLLEVIHADWNVVSEAGTTHWRIAELLKLCLPKVLGNKNYLNKGDYRRADREVNSRLQAEYEFLLTGDFTNGLQECPWCMNRVTSNTVGVIKKRTSFYTKEMELSRGKHIPAEPVEFAIVTRLLPHLVEEHYFFEGRGTPYRADPRFLIEAFGLRK